MGSIGFQSRVLGFTTFLQRLPPPPVLFIGAHALGFLSSFLAADFYLLFYPSTMHARALSQCLLYIILLPFVELAWSQVI
jgi:hypothetical protein